MIATKIAMLSNRRKVSANISRIEDLLREKRGDLREKRDILRDLKRDLKAQKDIVRKEKKNAKAMKKKSM